MSAAAYAFLIISLRDLCPLCIPCPFLFFEAMSLCPGPYIMNCIIDVHYSA